MAYKSKDPRYKDTPNIYVMYLKNEDHEILEAQLDKRFPYKRPTQNEIMREALLTFYNIDPRTLEVIKK